MESRVRQTATASTVLMALCVSLGSSAHAQSPVRMEPSTDGNDNAAPAVAVTAIENATPRLVSDWKIDDVSRARWVEQTPAATPPAKRLSTKQQKRRLATVLMAIGGAAAGAYMGAKVQGSLCECDDEGLTGGLYGGLAGGAIGAIIGLVVFR